MKYEIADSDEISDLKNNNEVNYNSNKRDSNYNIQTIYQKCLKILKFAKYLSFIITAFHIKLILLSNIKIKDKIPEIDEIISYYKFCKLGKLYEEIKNEPNLNPLISIIIPTYNKKREILPLLRSIQNQSFKKIEIIFVDDNSNDGTDEIIKKYMMTDSRIKIKRHDKNKGTLISRNDGAKIAIGKYILFIDPDDMFLKDILEKIYKIAEKNNTDIVEFQAVQLNSKNEFNEYFTVFNNITEVKQPELSYIMYNYTTHELITQSIWGKLIKKTVFIKSMKSIRDYYLEQNMCLTEGLLMLFAVFQNANSYIYYNKYGYLYKYNVKSMTKTKNKTGKTNKSIKNIFLYLEFLNEYTGNDAQKKKMAIYHFERVNDQYRNILIKATEGFDYLWKVLNSYLNSKYIEDEDKNIVKKVAEKIEKAQKNNKWWKRISF